jgi:hypothetical protein
MVSLPDDWKRQSESRRAANHYDDTSSSRSAWFPRNDKDAKCCCSARPGAGIFLPRGEKSPIDVPAASCHLSQHRKTLLEMPHCLALPGH